MALAKTIFPSSTMMIAWLAVCTSSR